MPYTRKITNLLSLYNEFVLLSMCLMMLGINAVPGATATQLSFVGWVLIVAVLLALGTVWVVMGPAVVVGLFEVASSKEQLSQTPIPATAKARIQAAEVEAGPVKSQPNAKREAKCGGYTTLPNVIHKTEKMFAKSWVRGAKE